MEKKLYLRKMKLALLGILGMTITAFWASSFEFGGTILGTMLGLLLMVFYGLFIALEMSWKYEVEGLR